MYSFVTLFDKNYLSKGLLMYESLKDNCSENFELYVLAMDDETYDYLTKEKLDRTVIISLSDMFKEYPVLEKLHQTRSPKEFCWTMSAFSVQYVMRCYPVDNSIYLDSDIFFYNDPKILIDEMGDSSVLITEHNFSPRYDSSEINGKYCVQFVFFRNDLSGNEVLENWRRDCENKCSSENEDGCFGDQKYLDTWESKYERKIYNCRNIGCGVAPWNLQKYEVSKENETIYVIDKITKIKRKLIFFHFQALRHIMDDYWNIGPCITGDDFKSLIYSKYISSLISMDEKLPENMRTPITNARIVDLVRFMPVPYLGEKTVECEFGITGDDCHYVSINDSVQSGEIVYKKSLYQGEWIIVERINNADFIKEKIYEILWEIQKKEIYGEATFSGYMHEILERNAAKKRIMTQIGISDLNDDNVDYPFYRRMKVTRFYDDIESDAGCVVYRDQLRAEAQNMRVDAL